VIILNLTYYFINYLDYIAAFIGSAVTIIFILINDFYKSRREDKAIITTFKGELDYNLKISMQILIQLRAELDR